MVAGGTTALVCGALRHTVVASHNMMVDACSWRRGFAQAGTPSGLEKHGGQFPQRLGAAGLPALHSRPTRSLPSDRWTTCAHLSPLHHLCTFHQPHLGVDLSPLEIPTPIPMPCPLFARLPHSLALPRGTYSFIFPSATDPWEAGSVSVVDPEFH